MGSIRYIKSGNFFVRDYNDGIIVAFKDVGDSSSSYADQIHQIVSKSFGVDLFASDIIESINGTDDHKESIRDSLFIYLENGVSIRACNINLFYLNKNRIEVKYCSEKVLTVQKKRSRIFWCACIFLLLCICGYAIFRTIIEPKPPVEVQEEIQRDNEEAERVRQDSLKAEAERVRQDSLKAEAERVRQDSLKAEAERARQDSLKAEAEKARQRDALKAEANGYVRIADQAYGDYTKSPDERKGLIALTNYQKALDLDKKHNLFLTNEKNKIAQRIIGLKKEAEKARQRDALKAEANGYVRIADQAYGDYAKSLDERKGMIALTNYQKALDLDKKHNLFLTNEKNKIAQRIIVLKKELQL